jgi:anthranilate phosphoribosyltransferase
MLAGALLELDSLHSLVVHGEPGLDEISPLGPTHVIEVRDGKTSEWTIDPKEFGYEGFSAEDLAGGDSADNARIVTETLMSKSSNAGSDAARAAVVMNAAAAIYVSGKAPTYADGMSLAQKALESGAGLAALERLRRAYST